MRKKDKLKNDIQDEQIEGEVVNDTDGGDQVTNVNVNITLIIPWFCWFFPFKI